MSENHKGVPSKHVDVRVQAAVDVGDKQHGGERLVPLLVELRDGEAPHQSAMTTFINEVQRPVRTFVRRRAEGCGFDASFVDDVVQEALTRIVLSAHRCRASNDRAAIAWVLSVADSAWSDTVRREGPTGVSLDDPSVTVHTQHSLEESAGGRHDLTPGQEILLRVAVGVMLRLSADNATLFWMRLIANEEWAIIGTSLGISATAARRRYQRAQLRMQRMMWEALATLPDPQQSLARTWLLARIDHLDADLGD